MRKLFLIAVALMMSIACGSGTPEQRETVFFGSYPYGEDGTEKPIEWIVLAKDGGKTLLLSRYLLDRVPYNDKSENVSWENCFIRKWLNEEFISKAFNDEENGRTSIRITQSTVKALFPKAEQIQDFSRQ